jgi:hypothetical protein
VAQATSSAGRPVELSYPTGVSTVRVGVMLPLEIKRALAASAERNDRRFGDELREALAAWTQAGRAVSRP